MKNIITKLAAYMLAAAICCAPIAGAGKGKCPNKPVVPPTDPNPPIVTPYNIFPVQDEG